MKLLLTGFEAFGGSQINPSEQVVLALKEKEFDGLDLTTAVLPVERFSGPETLISTFDAVQPDAVISLGEAGNNAAIRVERVAINLLDFLISDNGGHVVTDKPIVDGGPDAFFATLPAREMVQAMRDNGIPAQLSNSAGTYLCNQVMYEMLHHLHTKNIKIPAGFVHLPQLPEQVSAASPLRPSMSLDTMIQGVTVTVQTLVTHLNKVPA